MKLMEMEAPFDGLLSVIIPKTFSWESEKINVKFHENCENTGKVLKISCVRCHFVKFDIYFLGLSYSLVLLQIANYISRP